MSSIVSEWRGRNGGQRAEAHPDCSYCGDPFNESDHKPLLLQCGHTLCKSCLTNQQDDDIQLCTNSDCRKDWSDHKLASLPTVFSLIPRNGMNSMDCSGTKADVKTTGSGKEVMPAATNEGAGKLEAAGRKVVPAPNEENGSKEEFPKCEICYSDFNASDQTPACLPCGHVFCRWCLSCLKSQGRCECPTCRKSWSKETVENLQTVKDLIHPENKDKYFAKKSPGSFSPTQHKLNAEEVVLNADKLRSRSNSVDDSSSEIEIYVQNIDNKTLTIKAKKSDTVSSVYDKMRNQWGHRIDQQRLTYGSQNMNKNNTLNDYNVRNYSSLHTTGRMSGG